MTITGKYSKSYMIFTSEQRRSIQVFTYIHTKRKVSPPHSKHYYKHPIYFPLCTTDFQVRMISETCAFVRLYLFTSYHAKHLPPTTPQTDALTRRRHPRLPLNIHEMSWQRMSRHVRVTRKSSDNTIWRQVYTIQQMSQYSQMMYSKYLISRNIFLNVCHLFDSNLTPNCDQMPAFRFF